MLKPLSFIKNIFYDIKWSFQRFYKGYCDADIIDMDLWFTNIFPKMLNEFAKNCDSYPAGFNSLEDWKGIISRMSFCLKESNDISCSLKNEYDINYEENLKNLWIERNNEISKYQKDMFDEGMYLFKIYFYNLWL